MNRDDKYKQMEGLDFNPLFAPTEDADDCKLVLIKQASVAMMQPMALVQRLAFEIHDVDEDENGEEE